MEPDPIPWFPRWSSGKLLVLLWSIFALIMVQSYMGNLRANLIAVDYESPIKTHQDVLDKDVKVYMASAVQLVK